MDVEPIYTNQLPNDLTMNNVIYNTSQQSDVMTVDNGYVIGVITSIVVPVVFAIIAILGIIGNALVIFVVLSCSHMRTTTNALIMSLAVADLVFIIICVPFTAVAYAMPVWPFGVTWCKVTNYVINVTAYVSVYTLVMMAVDRYMAVVHPIVTMTIRTERNACIVIVISWLIIFLVNIPVWVQHDVVDYNFEGLQQSRCMNVVILEDGIDMTNGKMFYGCFFAFAYLLPLSVVICLYAVLLRHLPTNEPRGGRPKHTAGGGGAELHTYTSVPTPPTPPSNHSSPAAERLRANRRAVKLVVVVVSVFALCWFPWHLVNILHYWVLHRVTTIDDVTKVVINVTPFMTWTSDDDVTFFLVHKLAATCLAYMNSCMNPFLYAFLSTSFRQSFRRALGCQVRSSSGVAAEDRLLNCCSCCINAPNFSLAAAGAERVVAAAAADDTNAVCPLALECDVRK